MILVPSSIRNEAFSVLISGVGEMLEDTGQEDWVDHVAWRPRTVRKLADALGVEPKELMDGEEE